MSDNIDERDSFQEWFTAESQRLLGQHEAIIAMRNRGIITAEQALAGLDILTADIQKLTDELYGRVASWRSQGLINTEAHNKVVQIIAATAK